jgi:murein DD-endopeptidase MepM/ murein hydrolase activator NlpD
MTKIVTGLIVAVLLGCIGVPMLLISAVVGGSDGCTPAVANASGQPGIDRWDAERVSIADVLTSPNASASPQATSYCGSTGPWTQPVLAPVVSGYRTDERPSHDGVDLGATRGTPVRSASAGIVTIVRCDVVPQSHGCDQDGDPINVKGCGHFVDIDHAAGIVSRYCHMLTKPLVDVGDNVVAGQIIGLVGSSGHSSGPHLHFEIHMHSDHGTWSSVDPEVFMTLNHAPLGQPATAATTDH